MPFFNRGGKQAAILVSNYTSRLNQQNNRGGQAKKTDCYLDGKDGLKQIKPLIKSLKRNLLTDKSVNATRLLNNKGIAYLTVTKFLQPFIGDSPNVLLKYFLYWNNLGETNTL